MNRYVVRRVEKETIIGDEYRLGWDVIERIGERWGKRPQDEEYIIGTYRTRREAMENCPPGKA